MKLLIVVCLAAAAFASPQNRERWAHIDWSNVVPMTETPGFWDGREIKPTFNPRGPSRNGRIVGGNAADPHSVQYQAALVVNTGTTNGLCGGSLVAPTWVLTAAHCAPTTSTNIIVILGAHDITATEPSQQRSTVLPANYRNHPQYNPTNFNNDISMLLLPEAAIINNNVGIVVLPAIGRIDEFAGLIGLISGWGRTSDASQAISPTLRWANNQIITNAVCTATYGPSIIIPSTICMDSTAGVGNGICGGDTGGPLTVLEANRQLQVGVASFWSDEGCTSGYPSGFARVSSFRQWIQDTSGI